MVNQQEVELGAYSHPLLWSRTDGHKTGYAKPISFGVGAWFPPVKEGRGSSSLGSSVFGGDLPALLTYVTLVECDAKLVRSRGEVERRSHPSKIGLPGSSTLA